MNIFSSDVQTNEYKRLCVNTQSLFYLFEKSEVLHYFEFSKYLREIDQDLLIHIMNNYT